MYSRFVWNGEMRSNIRREKTAAPKLGYEFEQSGCATAKQKPWLFYSILLNTKIYSLHRKTHEKKSKQSGE